MRTKKNRGYVRKLKKELKEYKKKLDISLYNSHKFESDFRNVCFELNQIKARRVFFNKQFIVSDSDMRELYNLTTVDDVNKQLKDSFINFVTSTKDFQKIINIKSDDSFMGVGTRYNVSLELLLPY